MIWTRIAIKILVIQKPVNSHFKLKWPCTEVWRGFRNYPYLGAGQEFYHISQMSSHEARNAILLTACKGAILYSTWFNPVKWRAIKREIWQICLQIVDLLCKILLHFSYYCVLRWINEVGLNFFFLFKYL